jgi:DNA-binding Lrp family transcriptional regulator
MTKSKDILVVLKPALSLQGGESFAALAKALGMSASEVHASVGPLEDARLLETESRAVRAPPLFMVASIMDVPSSTGRKGARHFWGFEVLIESKPMPISMRQCMIDP